MPNNAIVKALLSALLFGVSTPLSKILIGRTNSFLLAGLLYIGSFVGLLPLYFWREKRAMPARIDRNNLRKISGAVFCGGIIGPVLLLLGLRSARLGCGLVAEFRSGYDRPAGMALFPGPSGQ